ncbi:hypothetical protein HPP92_026937 [Vanilla planifolia]|uniref:Kinesin motor domain-containing protein n=1 Tax=Vanilla planifolia TaxID=51239 RepID=A0A835U743_VANPL|nr:hypothetical protein HPP92_026937 [Vanilla planifolia]
MVGKANSARCRLPLSSMNTISGDNGGVPNTASSNGDCDGAGVVFNSREDVAKLLSKKSKLRSKADIFLQGRMNDMGNYIKRLISSINWYINLEDCYLAVEDELNSLLESEKGRHSEIESQMNSKIKELTSLIEEYQTTKVSLEENLRREESNKLELKGNIRVFCRVRPFLSDVDARGADGSVISYPTSVESLGRGIDLMYSAQKYCFTFDKVFAHESSQDDVFVEISQLVQSALDGYKVCIFAYGQTGSGKTYTMMGKPEAPEQKGLIPRSLEQIFETSQSLQCQGWTYKIQASMLEIYTETIRDLLSPNRSTSTYLSLLNKQYTIMLDSAGQLARLR